MSSPASDCVSPKHDDVDNGRRPTPPEPLRSDHIGQSDASLMVSIDTTSPGEQTPPPPAAQQGNVARPHVSITLPDTVVKMDAPVLADVRSNAVDPGTYDAPSSWLLEQLGTTEDAVQLPLFYQSVAYVITLIVSMFGLCMVLNLVTWRYPDPSTQVQLPDIMLDTLPDIPELEHVTDLILSILVAICFVIVGVVWAVSTGRMQPASQQEYDRLFVRNAHPYSSSYPYLLPWIRFFICYTAITLLRIVVLVATILPATDNKCRVRPSTGDFWWNTLIGVMSFGSANVHCGDLLFSGHAAVITLAVAAIWTYGPVVHRWLRSAAVLAMVAAWFTIFTSRSHYTDDVIIATYISVTLWALVKHNPARGGPIFCQLCIQLPCRWISRSRSVKHNTESVTNAVSSSKN